MKNRILLSVAACAVVLFILAACLSAPPSNPPEDASALSLQTISASAQNSQPCEASTESRAHGTISTPGDAASEPSEEAAAQEQPVQVIAAAPVPLSDAPSEESSMSEAPVSPAPEIVPTLPEEPSDAGEKPESQAPVNVSTEPESSAVSAPSRSESDSKKDLDPAAIEAELLRLVNRLREKEGAGALSVNEEMLWASRIRAKEVTTLLSHTRPDGTRFNTAFDEAGFSYAGKWYGENASQMHFPHGMYTEKEIAKQIYNSLVNSEGHLRNMEREQYSQTGIGIHIKYADTTTWVGFSQLFASE